jgi:hypothetical protein
MISRLPGPVGRPFWESPEATGFLAPAQFSKLGRNELKWLGKSRDFRLDAMPRFA